MLEDVSLQIPAGTSVAVLGDKGSGKSTLLRIIAGTEKPTEGRVERSGRVLTPASFARSLDPVLSGRKNARFLCRINGTEADVENRTKHIELITQLGSDFDRPVQTYTAPQRNRLSFSLSIVFDSQFYVADGFAFAGPGGFGSPESADMRLADIGKRKTFIFTAKGAQARNFLRKHCQAAIVLRDANAVWYDDIEVALSELEGTSNVNKVPEHALPILEKIKVIQNGLHMLSKGLQGEPMRINGNIIERVARMAEFVDVILIKGSNIAERGHRLREGNKPLLLVNNPGNDPIPYYDLNSQCTPLDDKTHHDKINPEA